MDHDQIAGQLGRIEAKLEMILTLRQEERESIKALTDRVFNLETFRWKLAGGLALGVMVLGVFLKFVTP